MSEVNAALARTMSAQHKLDAAISQFCAGCADRARNPFVPHPLIADARRNAHAALDALLEARGDAIHDMLNGKLQRKTG